ncbi:MAG TPA: putative toxin-antitoxin system toxin component, PIN family [Bacteroidetes bacterium]|nr:putative toxin-antitoxin system toxin component, PIN family [Bacteroidota bacterium]
MQENPELIVIDTNIWISFLITNRYKKLENLLIENEIIILFSEELLLEFSEVINRPKFKKYFSEIDVEELLNSLGNYIKFIEVNSKVSICRDPKDNFLLSLSLDGNADYLITGDKDLLEIKKISDTKIITISEFLNK